MGAEQSAAALGAPVATLLRAAADMLMSRGKVAPAQYLYSLSQVGSTNLLKIQLEAISNTIKILYLQLVWIVYGMVWYTR